MPGYERNAVAVSVADTVTDELMAAVARLLPTLSGSAIPPSRDHLVELVSNPATTLLVACRKPAPSSGTTAGGDSIMGMLTLAVFRIPTGVRAWIEDVVVDPDAGRQGIGTALMEAALTRARAVGAKTVDLTSRPSREAANRLYQRLGFVRRDTNVYRYDLDP